MKKTLKVLRTVVIVVLVLILVISIAIQLFAGAALKIGIEAGATKALNVGVTLGDADLSILAGQVELQDLAVNNPPGYQHEKLLQLKYGKVKVDIGSLMSETVKIKEIKFDGIDVTLEQRGVSGNNLQDIINSLPKAGEKPRPEPETAEEKPTKKLQIQTLEITNITVHAKLLPVPGRADTVTIKIDPIRMENLGSDDKLDTAKLTGKILVAITAGVASQGAGLLPEDMTKAMQSTLNQTLELGKTATEEGKKLLEEGKDVGTGIIEGFKGLLTPKEE
jgi:hypothetical protein